VGGPHAASADDRGGGNPQPAVPRYGGSAPAGDQAERRQARQQANQSGEEYQADIVFLRNAGENVRHPRHNSALCLKARKRRVRKTAAGLSQTVALR
jgi:hypothetical protein